MSKKSVFRAAGKNCTVTIDGKTFIGHVNIDSDGTVTQNGVKQGSVFGSISILVAGAVDLIETTLGSVEVTGNAGSIKTMSGDVVCGAVGGNVQSMSGDINCQSVAGSAYTMSGDIRGR